MENQIHTLYIKSENWKLVLHHNDVKCNAIDTYHSKFWSNLFSHQFSCVTYYHSNCLHKNYTDKQMTFKKLETGQEKRCKSDRVLLMSSLCHAQAILPFPPDKITLLLLCRSDHPIYLTHSPEYYNGDDDDHHHQKGYQGYFHIICKSISSLQVFLQIIFFP